MKQYYLRTTAIAIFVVLLFSVGCGASNRSLTKAEFVKRADAICKAAVKEQQAGYTKLIKNGSVPNSGPGVTAAASKFVDEVMVPSYQKQIDQISTLGAPSDDEQQVSAILSAMQEGLKAGQQQPLKFIRAGSALHKARSMAQAYGLKACS